MQESALTGGNGDGAVSDDKNPHRSWDLEQYKLGGGKRKTPFKPQNDDEIDELDHGWAQFAGDGAPPKMGVYYKADGNPLFLVALGTALLSIVTLGFYRFWMIARLRRHYWNSVRFQGDPLEYTGTGLEKLLGFLLAIMILAVYLGTVQLALTFIGVSYFDGNPLALQLSVLAVVPFIFWATYRARRYLAARTRWRGIRFGMETGAWGYMGRSLGLSFLTLITAGIAWPYQDFKQTKYMVDRTWFGDLKFEQDGSWLGLFSQWIWIYIAIAMMGLVLWGAATNGDDMMGQALAGGVIAFGYFLLFYLYMRYRMWAVRYLWDNRTLGDTTFENALAVNATVWTYMGGAVIVGLSTALVAVVLFGAFFGAWALSASDTQMAELARLMQGGARPDIDKIMSAAGLLVGLVAIYLVVFAAAYAFTQSFLIQPILRRQVEATTVRNSAALMDARQREEDSAIEAGGFADALGVDVGVGV